MDVRGVNTFPLHNRLLIPIFGRRPSYPLVWGFIYIFPFFLEQIKLGGDFTSFQKFKRFLKIELLQICKKIKVKWLRETNLFLILIIIMQKLFLGYGYKHGRLLRLST